MHHPMRILFADDHEAVRRGLRSLLQARWEVCGEASNGREAVELACVTRPDVVLLDLTMPELNGLDAARAILRQCPATRLLLLTMQPSEELTTEAQRHGIEGVMLKSDVDALAETLAGIERQTVHVAGAAVGPLRHIAGFFTSNAERYRIVVPFIADGVRRGQKAVHISDSAQHQAHLRRLSGAGVDPGEASRSGCFTLHPWEEMYLAGGSFDQHAMLGRIRRAFDEGADGGYPATLIVGDMEWALRPGCDDLAEYEVRLNLRPPAFPDVILCAYDLRRFRGDVILDVLRAHPAVIIGGSFCENRFYVQPEEFLAELAARRGDA